MPHQPTWLVIPGLGESISDTPYRLIRKHLKNRGFNVLAIRIKWSRTTLTDWIAQARSQATKVTPPIAGVFGFSMGALIALALASDLRPRQVIAASTSPYFTEALKLFSPRLMRKARKYIGKKEMADYWKHHAKNFTAFNGQTTFLYGEKDFEMVPKATKLLSRRMKGRIETILVPKAPHDLSHPNYAKSCIAIIDRLVNKNPRS